MGDVYYEQLIDESRVNPCRAESDQKKTGQDSQFWVDVLKSFKDDNFDIGPNIQAGNLCFQDRGGTPLDIVKCISSWATTEYLYKWFNGTQNAVASYRKRFDNSGGHDFFELEGIDGPVFELFCSKFCNSMKDVMYLTAWAITRGNEVLEFFLALLAPDLNPVDGWARPDMPATVAQSVTTSVMGKRQL
jgi:hypothetical protein